MSRRGFVGWMGVGTASAVLPAPLRALAAPAVVPPELAAGLPFSPSDVDLKAKALAALPFVSPATELPPSLRDLNYVQYRDIYFRPDAAVWKNEGLPFLVELFHRGFYYKDQIEVAIVEGDTSRHLLYSPRLFGFGDHVPRPLPTEDIGFAGLRASTSIGQRPGDFSEIVVFQGASYLRSRGLAQAYGLSSRGLAVKTASPEGEEFPVFREFWVERPAAGDTEIVVHALLDSPSVTGAYHFRVVPGDETIVDVEAKLYPRVDLTEVGIAPATSMFFFDANGRRNVDDYRPEVHDSDGLLMFNGAGERLWRPLANPQTLQVSAFQDTDPVGFGLIQRQRDFEAYQDLEANYEHRPSLWIEPGGKWGKGTVNLVEIPTDAEIHDNIVAYWRPVDPIPAGSEYAISYRLRWGEGPKPERGAVVVAASRRGRASSDHPTPVRLFVVDFAMPAGGERVGQEPEAVVSASAGTLDGVTVVDLDETGGWRLSFRLDPGDAATIELRAALVFTDGRPVETWVYRWTGD